MNTIYHPQIDGKNKWLNAIIKRLLEEQMNRHGLLDMAQFSYNLQKSGSSHYSLFELAMGQQPLTPHRVLGRNRESDVIVMEAVKRWNEKVDVARYYLTEASDKMKKFADRERREVEFKLGDKVLLRMNSDQFKAPQGIS
jgi:hypothetical protein